MFCDNTVFTFTLCNNLLSQKATFKSQIVEWHDLFSKRITFNKPKNNFRSYFNNTTRVVKLTTVQFTFTDTIYACMLKST
jgi:hypothetical protein